jgi:hypothetical protein
MAMTTHSDGMITRLEQRTQNARHVAAVAARLADVR